TACLPPARRSPRLRSDRNTSCDDRSEMKASTQRNRNVTHRCPPPRSGGGQVGPLRKRDAGHLSHAPHITSPTSWWRNHLLTPGLYRCSVIFVSVDER